MKPFSRRSITWARSRELLRRSVSPSLNTSTLLLISEYPRAGFDGLIVEAKSGSQQYGQAVAQLRTYRSARQRRPGSRYLLLGIVERPNDPELTHDELAGFIAAGPSAEDLWLFSGADGIERTLMAVFGP